MRNTKLIVFTVIAVAAIIGLAGLYHINGDSFDLNGRQMVLVTTDSMDGDVTEYAVDSFPADTLVVIKHIPDSQKKFLRAGDVISYYNVNGLLVHHRITQAEDGFVYVHGDNNTSTEKVYFEDINGKVVGTSWIAGHVLAFTSANTFLILAGAFVLSALVAFHAVYRRNEDDKGRTRKLVASVAVVLILAVSFTGIGYAYQSLTVNEDNTVTSEYVTMVQSKYTFTNYDLRFDTMETEAGIFYRLLGESVELVTIDGKKYFGIEVGSDTLRAVRTGGSGDLDITISSLDLDNTWFTDYSGQLHDWRYIIRITGDDPETTQYAYYDGKMNGSGEGVWKYKDSLGATIEKITLQNDTVYTTKLFFAGAGEYSGASFNSEGTEIKVPSTLTVYPRWVPADVGDTYKCVLKSSDGVGCSQTVMYVVSGDTLTLPGNIFETPSGMVFVGWKEEGGKTFMPWHTYENYSRDRTFTAQWRAEDSENIMSVTFSAGPGAVGTMGTQYVLDGNTYTLPFCGFSKVSSGSLVVPAKTTSMPVTVYNSTNEVKTVTLTGGCTVEGSTTFDVPASSDITVTVVKNITENDVTVTLTAGCTVNYKFSGWEITAVGSSPDRDYSKFTDPYTDLPELAQDILLTAKWTATTEKNVMLVLQDLPQTPGRTYTVFSDDEGKYTLPHCIFNPPENIQDEGFEGWQFIGWSVYKMAGSLVPQSYTIPTGTDGYIIKNGTIKFVYQNDSVNEQNNG